MIEPNTTFTENALWHIAKLIASRYKSDISNLGFTDHKSISQFFWRAGFNASPILLGIDELLAQLVRIQKNDPTTGVNNILKIIEQLCDPEEYIGEDNERRIVTQNINDILLRYRLRIKDDGKVRTLSRFEQISYETILKERKALSVDVGLFDTRELHPEVIEHGRLHFIEGRYFHAVFECCKAFDRYVSKKANSNEYGTRLMERVLSPGKALRLNTLQTETEKNEQLGLMHLSTGLMFTARNPGGHEPELDYPLSREDAIDLLCLISFLYRQIDKTNYVGIP